jgi:hypothetical protein
MLHPLLGFASSELFPSKDSATFQQLSYHLNLCLNELYLEYAQNLFSETVAFTVLHPLEIRIFYATVKQHKIPLLS